MPFTFRMTLSGLMVVVPDRPFESAFGPAGSVTVLLPNLLRPHPLENGDKAILDPHLPFLEFPLAARQSASTRAADLLNPARNTGLCKLLGEEIEILAVPGLPVGFTLDTREPADPNQANPDEQKSLFWLATMEQAAPGRGTLKPGLLDSELGEKKDIVARMRVERGRFRTFALSTELCRFEPKGPAGFERRVAISLALEIEGVPSHVALSMKKTGEEPEVLVLAGKDGEVVELNLMNSEIEDVMNPQPAGQVDLDPDRPVADFEVFYDLADGFRTRNRKEPKRFLRQFRPDDDDTGSAPPHALCSPTGMNATKAA